MHPGIITILEAVKLYGPKVEAYKALGSIKVSLHPLGELLIFNYTKQASAEGRWNEVERVSRGLIVHWPTLKVVAMPFEKFFGLNELPETQIQSLPEGPCEVTVKLDGSLGILYRIEEKYAISTRGNFVSNQALWATQYLQQNYNLRSLAADLTLLFEIIYPENKIIVNYGKTEALFLVGARRLDGYDFSYTELLELAKQYGFPVVPAIQVESFEELIPLAKNSKGVEGWVVRFNNGLRIKVKTSEYNRITKILSGLTPKTIRDLWLKGPDEIENALRELPEEIYQEMREVVDAMNQQVIYEEKRILDLFEQIPPKFTNSRREFAMYVRTNYPAESLYLFTLLDHKPIRPLILKNLEL